MATEHEANAVYGSGVVNYSSGRFAQALQEFESSLAMEEELGRKLGQIRCLSYLGDTKARTNELTHACAYYLKAIKIQKTLEKPLPKATILNKIADTFLRRDKFGLALGYYTQSLEIRKKHAPRSIALATTLNGIAQCLWHQLKRQDAIKYFSKSL